MEAYYSALKYQFQNEQTPKLILDLDRFDANLSFFEQNIADKKIRIASKSVRSTQVLQHILAKSNRISGIMTYSLEEALILHSKGFQDILMGYPTIDESALKKLSQNESALNSICLMVDSKEHISVLEKLHADNYIPFRICMDIDMSSNFPGKYFGVRRSPIQNTNILNSLLDVIEKSKVVKLVGLMGYEAQIAGVTDTSPHRKSLNPIIKFLKKKSVKEIEIKREKALQEIQKRHINLEFVNAGGSGSYDSSSLENGVTEITIGSGLYCSHLFDHYSNLNLQPSLFYSLNVSRIPHPNMITCQSGGFIASGVTGIDKQPEVFLPKGLIPLNDEGFGEVQTPFVNNSGMVFSIGDPIFVRHAKAGEICEHFNTITILREQKIYEVWNTYRGEGFCFY